MKARATIITFFVILSQLAFNFAQVGARIPAAELTGSCTGTGLVGCWEMEENGGMNLTDGSPSANTATLHGALAVYPTWVPGKVGSYALEFDEPDRQYASVPDNSTLDMSNAITLAAWIQPGVFTMGSSDIISKATIDTVDGYQLSLGSTTSSTPLKVSFRINQATSGNTYRLVSTSNYPTDGTWMHVAATFNGTLLKLYLNGILEASLTTPPGTTIATNSVALGIGGQASVSDRWYTGALDDVRIYNVALSQEEILELADKADQHIPSNISLSNNVIDDNMPIHTTVGTFSTTDADVSDTFTYTLVSGAGSTDNASFNILGDTLRTAAVLSYDTKPSYSIRVRSTDQTGLYFEKAFTISINESICGSDPALVGCWEMEEGSGTMVYDGSPFHNDAWLQVQGQPLPTWVTGKVGNYALHLSGTAQYADTYDSESLHLTTDLTLAAWIKPAATGPRDIISKARQDTVDGYQLSLTSAQTIQFRINQATSGNTYRINSTSTYPIDGTWMHVAATYNGVTMKLYINGILEASLTPTVAPTINPNTVYLGIGGQSNNDRWFAGDLDDVRIYNRPLDQEEILALAGKSAEHVPTDLDLSSDSVQEAQLVNTTVGTFSTTDEDGGAFTYTLVSGVGSSNNASFNISGNTLRTSAVFDYETKNSYSIRVRSTDSTGLFVEKVFTISIEYVPPSCSSDPDLVGCWEMEEGSGLTLIDGSSHGNNATLHGHLAVYPTWVPGKLGNYALEFDEPDQQYASVPDNASLDMTGAMTVAAWIQPGAFTMGSSDIVSKATIDTVDGYQLSLGSPATSTPMKVTFRINQATNGNTYRIVSTSDYPTDGTWMHVAATYDGTNMKLYINCNLEATMAVPPGTLINSNSVPLGIGGQASVSDRWYTGALDDVRLYKTALSATDILHEGCYHNPTGMALSSNTVAENQPSNTTVGTFSTTDPDAGNSFTYQFVVGAGDDDNSSFGITGNTLKTAASFNYEAKSSYTIRVRTTDNSGLFYDQAFTINVTDVNEAPTITDGTSVAVETYINGMFQPFDLTLHATDPEEDVLTWSIDPAHNGNHGTATASGTGASMAISYTPDADYYGTDSFIVVVTDAHGLTDTITVNVNVKVVILLALANR